MGALPGCLSNLLDFGTDNEMVVIGFKSFKMPKSISYHSSIGTSMKTISGNSIQEYNTKLNSKTKFEGNYNFVSASIDADIGKASANSLISAFSKVQYRVDLYTLQLPPHRPNFLARLIMGHTSVTDKSTFNSEFNLDILTQMSYKALVGSISAEEQLKYGKSIKSFQESGHIKLNT